MEPAPLTVAAARRTRPGWLAWLAMLASLWACGQSPEGPGSRAGKKAAAAEDAAPRAARKLPAPPTSKPQPKRAGGGPVVEFYECPARGLLSPAAICVYQMLKAGGDTRATYVSIARELREKPVGADLDALAARLVPLGIECVGRREPLASLLARGRPGLILTRAAGKEGSRKLLLCLGRDAAGVRLVDPSLGRRVIAERDLEATYLGTSLQLTARPTRPAREAPDLVCEELVWSYGTVSAGRAIHHSFRLRNNGTRPLKIEWLETHCGCAAAKVNRQEELPPDLERAARAEKDYDPTKRVRHAGGEIPPGETGWVSTYVNTLHRHGVLTFPVTLKCNDPEEPNFCLFLTGRIVPEFVSEPETIWFVAVPASQGGTAHVWIRHRQRRPFRIDKLACDRQFIHLSVDPDPPREARKLSAVEARLLPARAHPENEGWVAIKVHCAAGAPVGPFSGKISLTANGIPLETFVAGYTVGNLAVNPPAFALGALDKGEACTATVSVTSRLGKAFVVHAADVNRGFMKVRVAPAGPGACQVMLSLDAGWDAPDLRGEVTLHTNDPLEPEKKVPVYGFVKRGA